MRTVPMNSSKEEAQPRWINIRPLVVWAIALILGIALANTLEPTWALAICYAFCFIILVLICITRARHLWWLVVAAVLCIGGFCYAYVRLHPTYAFVPWEDRDYLLRGTVEDVSYEDGETTLELGAAQVNGRYLDFQVLLTVSGYWTVQTGDFITCNATMEIPSQGWSGFSYRTYLLSQGVGYLGKAEKLVVTEMPLRIKDIPRRCAAWLGERLDDLYGEYAGTLKGMVLGDTAAMSETVLESFQKSGVQHVLAVSGLHVSMIAGALGFVINRLRLRTSVRFWLMAAAIWFYCLLVGAPPSAVRACIMANVVMGAQLFWRKSDMLCSISFAAILILLFNPLQLFHAGFQMSFAAVLGIAFFQRPFTAAFQRIYFPKWLASAASVSMAAQIGIAPVLMNLFGNVQFLAIFPNLVIVPLASVVTVLALLSCLVGPVGAWIAFPVRYLTWGMQMIAGLFSELPTTMVERLPGLAVPTLYSGMFCLTRYFHPHPREVRYIACGALGLILIIILIA